MVDDPYLNRESKRYRRPIASREYILSTLKKVNKPCTINSIEKLLNISNEIEKNALVRRLKAMIRDGQLLINRAGFYLLAKETQLKKAKVFLLRNSYARLDFIDEDFEDEFYLTPRQVREVMHDDTVLVRLSTNCEEGKCIAILVDVIERGIKSLVGCYLVDSKIAYISPVNKLYKGSILVKKGKIVPKHGEYVIAKILNYPTRHREMCVKVVKILGDHNISGLEKDLAVKSYNLPDGFSNESLTMANKIKNEEIVIDSYRKDWRDLPFVTIDGEDARDFDDAVYVEENSSYFNLYVAIADVSHYVVAGSPLDKDAYMKGTSVYLPGNVIPMLPEQLSNDICSLCPKKDRLVLGIKIKIMKNGKIQDYCLSKAVICSHERMIYKDVSKMISAEIEIPNWFKKPLNSLHNLFQILLKRREKRGSIDFDFPESKILFNKEGRIQEVVLQERTLAHRIIEECMLVANEVVAKYLLENNLPGIYRVHKEPEMNKLDDLVEYLRLYNIKFDASSNVKPSYFQNLLKKVKSADNAKVLESLILSTMTQAFYHAENQGHFGLSYDYYCHFTSPIRRYSDLVVHRSLTKNILNIKDKDFKYSDTTISQTAKQCSITERRADDASRYVLNWLKCHYMKDKINNEYVGTISGVKNFGLFVTIDDLNVDGMIHITQLPNDYYNFDPVSSSLVGRKNGREFVLGQKINIKVVKVDTIDNLIDFSFIS